MRASIAYLSSAAPVAIDLPPISRAVLRLPASAMARVYRRLCDGVLVVQATRLSVRPGSGAGPYLNSSTPLLANLTSVQLGTVCNGTLTKVSRLP